MRRTKTERGTELARVPLVPQINIRGYRPLSDRNLTESRRAGDFAVMRFLVHVLIVALALAVAAAIVPGVDIESGGTLVLAAIVLGVLNAIVRPILFILTLPITILTLGLFYLVVNGIAFGLAAALVPGFTVSSWLSAIGGAFVTGLVSWLAGALRTQGGAW